MDVISLALALKALKNSGSGSGEDGSDFERVNNKINAIIDDNKASTDYYPSVKAVVDYVNDILTDITEAQY